jgi:hypothetical protein
MAFLRVIKTIVPQGKTIYIVSSDAQQAFQQAGTNTHIVGQLIDGYAYDSNDTDGQTKVSGTFYQGAVWSNEEAYNTYAATPAVQTDNAARDAYNTQHGITRTVQTLTI